MAFLRTDLLKQCQLRTKCFAEFWQCSFFDEVFWHKIQHGMSDVTNSIANVLIWCNNNFNYQQRFKCYVIISGFLGLIGILYLKIWCAQNCGFVFSLFFGVRFCLYSVQIKCCDRFRTGGFQKMCVKNLVTMEYYLMILLS